MCRDPVLERIQQQVDPHDEAVVQLRIQRRQRRIAGLSEPGIVRADDRDVLGDFPAEREQPVEESDRHAVADAQDPVSIGILPHEARRHLFTAVDAVIGVVVVAVTDALIVQHGLFKIEPHLVLLPELFVYDQRKVGAAFHAR